MVSPDCDKEFFEANLDYIVNLVNTLKNDDQINIFCVHPGWIRTNGKEDNPAPLSSYDADGIKIEIMQLDENSPQLKFMRSMGD